MELRGLEGKLIRISYIEHNGATFWITQGAGRKWPRVLNAFARQVNPHLGTIRRAGLRATTGWWIKANTPPMSCFVHAPTWKRSSPPWWNAR